MGLPLIVAPAPIRDVGVKRNAVSAGELGRAFPPSIDHQMTKPPLSRRKAMKSATFSVEKGKWHIDGRT